MPKKINLVKKITSDNIVKYFSLLQLLNMKAPKLNSWLKENLDFLLCPKKFFILFYKTAFFIKPCVIFIYFKRLCNKSYFKPLNMLGGFYSKYKQTRNTGSPHKKKKKKDLMYLFE